jgi:hypothetical protein
MSINIYVASSWRNTYQPSIVSVLIAAGYFVYDFRNPAPENDGFRWSEIDPNWKSWTVEKYAAALEHPVAVKGFNYDFEALSKADLCVLVLPSGRSASWEYGYHNGVYGRSGIVYVAEPCEPELMYRGSLFVDTNPKLLAAVEKYIKEHSLPERSR